MENHKAKTSGHWVAYEMAVDVGGKKVYNWNVMDSETRYIPATHLSPYRDAHAARAVMRKAALTADKPPETIATDKWRACIRPIKELMPEAKHIQSEGITADINNLPERLQGTCRDRIKTLRGLDRVESGQRYLDEWTLNYNLFRKRHSLRNQTPGYRAKVNPSFTEWAGVVKTGPCGRPHRWRFRKRGQHRRRQSNASRQVRAYPYAKLRRNIRNAQRRAA